MTHRTGFAAVALALFAGASASASVTPMNASVTASVRDAEFATIDSLLLAGPGQVDINTVGNFDANVPEFGADISVDFSVVTVGLTRTVTVIYSTGGPGFVTQDAFEDMFARPDDGFYGLAFGLNFSDDEWDGDITTRGSRAQLLGDGVFISDPVNLFFSSTAFLTPSGHAFLDATSPAEPGFFGANVVADEFRYVVEYTIVPAPGVLSLAAMGLGMMAKRRR